jgi:hypothetical protein
MKRTYKYLTTFALSGLLCVFITRSANAQHRDGSGSSGSSSGGSHASGGSSGGNSNSGGSRPSGVGYSGGNRPSGGSYNAGNRYGPAGGRPSVNRPSFNGGGYRPSNGVGYVRSSNSNARVAIAPPRAINPGYSVATAHRVGPSAGVNSYTNRTYASSTTIGTRGYIGAGGRASVGVGGRGFYGPSYSYWRTSGYYHYYHGYYGTYYAPRIGFSIGFLPYGYYPFYYGDLQYYYSGGLFYQYDNNEYTVVDPPIGAEVNELPSNAQSIVINGDQYYESNGVYYEPITKDDGSISYQVAGKDGELNTNNGDNVQQAPQVGDIVQSLPPDCRKISLNGEKYYVSPDGYYYQEVTDPNHNRAYKIVGTPDETPQE